MASPERPYVRVYHDDLRRDYPDVYGNDAALALWLRLLVLADKMWPILAELPRSVRKAPLTMLVERGLIRVDERGAYTVKGYNAERSKRQESARSAAAVRWQSGRNADASAEAMPRPRPSPSPSPKDPPTPLGPDRRQAPVVLGTILEQLAKRS